MQKFLRWLGSLPLRLRALVLCVLILVPIMLIATKYFPEDRKTILVASCFAVAAIYAFFGLGSRRRATGT